MTDSDTFRIFLGIVFTAYGVVVLLFGNMWTEYMVGFYRIYPFLVHGRPEEQRPWLRLVRWVCGPIITAVGISLLLGASPQ